MAIPYMEYDVTADTKVNPEQRELITKLGLEVRRFKDDRYEITDPVYRDAKGGHGGKYAGKDLAGPLNDAVYSRDKLSTEPAKAASKVAKKDAMPATSSAAVNKTTSNKRNVSLNAPGAPEAQTPKAMSPEKMRKPRDSKYKKAMRIIAQTSGITDVILAKEIGSSRHYAGYLIQTFNMVKEVLAESPNPKN